MQNIIVKCTGTSPLLMNRMSKEVLEGLFNGPTGKGSKTKTRPPTTRDAAIPRVYEQDGKPYIPTENLFACLVAAGVFIRLDAKRQLSTAKSTLLPAYMSIEDKGHFLVHPDTGAPVSWEVDMRQGKNPNGNEAVCIIRPRFDVWSFEANIILYDDEIDAATIRRLWDYAGRRIGLGDFRPARKGIFGQFRVDEWRVKPDSIPFAAQ